MPSRQLSRSSTSTTTSSSSKSQDGLLVVVDLVTNWSVKTLTVAGFASLPVSRLSRPFCFRHGTNSNASL